MYMADQFVCIYRVCGSGTGNTPEVRVVPLIRPDVPHEGIVYGDHWSAVISIALDTNVLSTAGRFDGPSRAVIFKCPL
jgi:hypothetical protein